jgi:hypothetical protein
LLVGMSASTTTMSNNKKLKIDMAYDPAVSLLGIYPKGCESVHYKAPAHPCFLITIHNSQLWKQSRCYTTDEWIKKIWYVYTMEFYSATKKNNILSFAGKWMKMENIILSVVSQAQKAKTCILPHMRIVDLGQMQ